MNVGIRSRIVDASYQGCFLNWKSLKFGIYLLQLPASQCVVKAVVPSCVSIISMLRVCCNSIARTTQPTRAFATVQTSRSLPRQAQETAKSLRSLPTSRSAPASVRAQRSSVVASDRIDRAAEAPIVALTALAEMTISRQFLPTAPGVLSTPRPSSLNRFLQFFATSS